MKLYERITEDNWIKREYERDGKGCLAYHVDQLYGGARWEECGSKLYDAIALFYPERTCSVVVWGITGFNDHVDTTLEDILRVCKFADV